MSSSPDAQPRDTAFEMITLMDSQVDQEVENGSPDLLTTSLVSNANLERQSSRFHLPGIENTQAESHVSSTVNLVDDQRSSDTLPKSYTTKLEPGNTNPSSRKGTLKRVLSCWPNWNWEIANSAISIIALAATIGTLLPHQNQPLPQWPFHISINALLSIYSVVLKGSATFPAPVALDAAKATVSRRISPEERSKLVHKGYSVTQPWLRYNIPWNATNSDLDHPESILFNTGAEYPVSMDARGCTYMFGPYLDLTLQAFFEELKFFDGEVTGASGYLYYLNVHIKTRPVDGFSGPIELQTLYNSSNVSFASINHTFDNIATGFTNYIRQNGNANCSAPAEGVVWRYATWLNIHWPWIALPASLVPLKSLVLLPLTIMSTARAEAPVWKAHPLPFILRGPFVDEDSLPDGQGPRPSQSMDRFENMVKQVKVRLDQAEGDARLVAAVEGLGGGVVRRRRVRRSVSLDEYQMG